MPNTIQFSSQYKELRLIRRPAEERVLPNGNVATVAPEIVLEFKDHYYWATEGKNKMADRYDEAKDKFVDQDELTWMRNHPEFGMLFHEIPDEVPASTDIFREIAVLAAKGDREALMELGRDEVEGYNRPDVLELLRETIETMPDEVTAGET